jgi:preprotein translocase subunit YajC
MFYLNTLAAAQAETPTVSPLASLLPMILVIGVFWVLMIVPQRKQQKKRNEMLNALKKGDKVITVGGIHGEITELNDDEVKLRIADKVEVKMAKTSVSRVKGE